MPLLSPPSTSPFMTSLHARYNDLAVHNSSMYSSLREYCCPGVLYISFWLMILDQGQEAT